MKLTKIMTLLSVSAVVGISGAAQAEGFYGTAMIGKSFQAQDAEPYGNNLGVDTTFPNEFDSGDGMVGTVGVGYSVNDQIRVEGRLSYREADFNSRELGMGERDGEEFILNGDIKSTALTIEGFYDIPTGTVIKPYVKAGIGASRNSYSARLGGTGVSDFDPVDGVTDGYYDGYADTTSTEFTWNVGIGASYAINEQMSIIGEYQYVSLGEAKTGQDSFTDGFKVDKAAAHEVQLGLQYQF